MPDPETTPPEVLEAAIEAAHPEHVIEGAAEPPSMVPAPGEMPLEPIEPDVASTGADEPAPVPAAVAPPAPAPAAYVVAPVVMPITPAAEPEVAKVAVEPDPAPPPPVAAAEPEPVPPPPRPKPSGPATSPGAAFNPEVVPADD